MSHAARDPGGVACEAHLPAASTDASTPLSKPPMIKPRGTRSHQKGRPAVRLPRYITDTRHTLVHALPRKDVGRQNAASEAAAGTAANRSTKVRPLDASSDPSGASSLI